MNYPSSDKPLHKVYLREVCRKKYGDDFVKMYDMVNRGIPIGNIEETIT